MTKTEFLEKVKKKVLYVYDRQEIVYELSAHIDDSARELVEEKGLSYDEAVEIAINQMGNPNDIGKQLNKEHNPFIGYLLLLSKVFIILNIIPIIFLGISFVQDIYYSIFSTTTRGGEVVLDVNQKIVMPTHDVWIKNVCVKDGTYYVTYRSRQNFQYSRSSAWIREFEIFDDYGVNIHGSANEYSGLLVDSGFREFHMPENKVIHLNFVDKQILTIDLTEYVYE